MYARVTQFEIDTVRIGLNDALYKFMELVLPRLRCQPGFEGVYVMHTPEGKGELITLWANAEAAEETFKSGFWQEQVAEFVTFMRQAPGREHYDVVYAEAPAAVAA